MEKLKRTQTCFPEDVLRKLKQKAHDNKTTVTEIVRSAVSEYMKKEKTINWIEDPLWNMIGSSSSKEGDLSIHHDKYLYGKNR